ncbi:MAG: hypothetical protein ACI8ZV_002574, partial [Chitinophagales bacterium]
MVLGNCSIRCSTFVAQNRCINAVVRAVLFRLEAPTLGAVIAMDGMYVCLASWSILLMHRYMDV